MAISIRLRDVLPLLAALVLVVGSLWAGTLDLGGGVSSEKNAATGVEYADSASTTSYSAPNAMMARTADTATYDLYVAEESGASAGGTSAADSGATAATGRLCGKPL